MVMEKTHVWYTWTIKQDLYKLLKIRRYNRIMDAIFDRACFPIFRITKGFFVSWLVVVVLERVSRFEIYRTGSACDIFVCVLRSIESIFVKQGDMHLFFNPLDCIFSTVIYYYYYHKLLNIYASVIVIISCREKKNGQKVFANTIYISFKLNMWQLNFFF